MNQLTQTKQRMSNIKRVVEDMIERQNALNDQSIKIFENTPKEVMTKEHFKETLLLAAKIGYLFSENGFCDSIFLEEIIKEEIYKEIKQSTIFKQQNNE